MPWNTFEYYAKRIKYHQTIPKSPTSGSSPGPVRNADLPFGGCLRDARAARAAGAARGFQGLIQGLTAEERTRQPRGGQRRETDVSYTEGSTYVRRYDWTLQTYITIITVSNTSPSEKVLGIPRLKIGRTSQCDRKKGPGVLRLVGRSPYAHPCNQCEG